MPNLEQDTLDLTGKKHQESRSESMTLNLEHQQPAKEKNHTK